MTTAEARTYITSLTNSLNALDAMKQTELDPFAAQALEDADEALLSSVMYWKTQ